MDDDLFTTLKEHCRALLTRAEKLHETHHADRYIEIQDFLSFVNFLNNTDQEMRMLAQQVGIDLNINSATNEHVPQQTNAATNEADRDFEKRVFNMISDAFNNTMTAANLINVSHSNQNHDTNNEVDQAPNKVDEPSVGLQQNAAEILESVLLDEVVEINDIIPDQQPENLHIDGEPTYEFQDDMNIAAEEIINPPDMVDAPNSTPLIFLPSPVESVAAGPSKDAAENVSCEVTMPDVKKVHKESPAKTVVISAKLLPNLPITNTPEMKVNLKRRRLSIAQADSMDEQEALPNVKVKILKDPAEEIVILPKLLPKLSKPRPFVCDEKANRLKSSLLKPIAPRPIAPNPIAQRPIAPNPIAQRPIAPKPIVSMPIAQKPIAPKLIASMPIASKPTLPKPIVDRPKPILSTPKPFASKPNYDYDVPTSTSQSSSKLITSTPKPVAAPLKMDIKRRRSMDFRILSDAPISAMKKRDAPSRKSVSFERPFSFIESYEKLTPNKAAAQASCEQIPQAIRGSARGIQILRKRNTDREMHDRNPIYRSQCQLCNRKEQYLGKHYEKLHPNHEVPTSRPTPEFAKLLRTDSIDFKYFADGKIQGKCGFCEELKTMDKRRWAMHLLAHTGEKAYSCATCKAEFDFRTKHTMHRCNRRTNEEPINIFQANDSDSYSGFMCKDCNYLQISRNRIIKHLKNEHGYGTPMEDHQFEACTLVPFIQAANI